MVNREGVKAERMDEVVRGDGHMEEKDCIN